MQKKVYFFAFSLVLSVVLPFYLALLCFFGLLLSKRSFLFIILYVAFLYGSTYQLLIVPTHVPIINQVVEIRAEIEKLIRVGQFYQSIIVKTTRFNGQYFHARLKLTDYQTRTPLKEGEEYWFKAKLKPIKRYYNEGSVDKSKIMRAKGIIGRGYIKEKKKITEIKPSWISMLRSAIARQLSQQIKSNTLLGLVQSLSIGKRDLIDKNTWTLFRETGTGHLIAISGLHIGLITAFFYYLCLMVW